MSTDNSWAGTTLRLRVEGPAHGGEFVARHEGRVVFCRGAITGELVEARVYDDPGRRFCRADVTSVLEPSPQRREPYCPSAAAGSGCCDWSHINPDAARSFLGQVLAEQFSRIAKVPVDGESVHVVELGSRQELGGWRTVARWETDSEGRPGTRRLRSHAIVTEPCVQPDRDLVEAVLSTQWKPGEEILGVLGDDGQVHLAHRAAEAPRSGQAPSASGHRGSPSRGRRRGQASRSRARREQAGQWRIASGSGIVTREVNAHSWELPVDAFWQAHAGAAHFYSAVVQDQVTEFSPQSVWDLYGGAGVLTASVDSAEVTVVDTAAASIAAGKAAFSGRPSFYPVCSPVRDFLAGVEAAPELVVLDPPRGGAGIEVMTRLVQLGARRIVHIGCDVASLARDVGVLVAAGWTLREVSGVAAFPGTHHVEGIAILDSPTVA